MLEIIKYMGGAIIIAFLAIVLYALLAAFGELITGKSIVSGEGTDKDELE